MPMPPCVTLPWGYMCSPWKFSRGYWTDAGSIGDDFEKCGSHWECSKETVKAYVTHYMGTDNTCENYARVHLGVQQRDREGLRYALYGNRQYLRELRTRSLGRTDAGSIGDDFEKCGSHWECSKETVKAYVTHYMG